MITPEQLQEWSRLAQEATPGPWEWEPEYHEEGSYTLENIEPPYFEPAIVIFGTDGFSMPAPNNRDAIFIAASREAIPALIAEVARLEAANTEMSDELTHRRENFETMLQRLLDEEHENAGLEVGLRENEAQRTLDQEYYRMHIEQLQAEVARLQAEVARLLSELANAPEAK